MRGGRIPFLGTLRSQISVAYSLLFAVAFLLLNLSVTRLVGEFLISQRTNAQLEDARETAAQFSVPAAEKNASALYALSVRNADSWKGARAGSGYGRRGHGGFPFGAERAHTPPLRGAGRVVGKPERFARVSQGGTHPRRRKTRAGSPPTRIGRYTTPRP